MLVRLVTLAEPVKVLACRNRLTLSNVLRAKRTKNCILCWTGSSGVLIAIEPFTALATS